MKFLTLLRTRLVEFGKCLLDEVWTDKSTLTIAFPPEALSTFKDTQRKVGAERPVDVLKKAILLYEMLTDHLIDGGTITLKDEKGQVQELKIEDLFVKVPSKV